MDARKISVLELLNSDQQVSVGTLARQFGVSEMTIRRDLDELQRQGLAVRTHGGAVSTGRLRFMQAGLAGGGSSWAKAAIGAAAAVLIEPGWTVVFDTGTTALEVAKHMPRDPSITVATTSLCVAQELYSSPSNIILLGGILRKEFPSVYGPITERLLNDIQVDLLIMGCDAASSESGFYTNDIHISSLESSMMRVAHKAVVVTESAKFGRRAFARYATLDQVHTLVTDSGLSDVDRGNLETHGIRIITANV